MSDALRVLIVEDDAVVLMQLEMLIEDAGHIVVGTAMSADEALPLIKQARPDLLLLDLRLNDGSSGIEVARAMRDCEDVTIVFVTANARSLTDDMHGAAAVIAKPFSAGALLSSIAYLEECVRRPPPALDLPRGLRLAPAYHARMEGMRA